MASRVGTQIISPIRIQDDTIPQPVAFVNELQGGAQSGPTLAGMFAIPVWLRQFGMFYTVYNDGANNGTYVLKFGLNSLNIADNSNWQLFAGSSTNSNVKKIDQAILNQGTINLPANSFLLTLMINAAAELVAASIGYSAGGTDLMMTQDIPAGYYPLTKGIFYPAITTIYFNGITTQSLCSAIFIQF